MYPFIKKVKDKLLVRLNKEIYSRDLIDRAAKEETDSIMSIKQEGNYYLLELNVDGFKDYFDFLNYLIYLTRSK